MEKKKTKGKAGYPEKVERNREIYLKKEKGETYRKLSLDYNLSTTTLLKIIQRWRAKKGKV